MSNYKARPLLKVAILCVAVSLLSFFAGANFGKSSHKISEEDINNLVAAAISEQHEMEPLKPILDVLKIIENKYFRDVDTEKLIEGPSGEW